MFRKIFLDHPETVNESYWEHFGNACSFGARMFVMSIVSFIHALIPCLFVRTASSTIEKLHDRMVINRHAQTKRNRERHGQSA